MNDNERILTTWSDLDDWLGTLTPEQLQMTISILDSVEYIEISELTTVSQALIEPATNSPVLKI